MTTITKVNRLGKDRLPMFGRNEHGTNPGGKLYLRLVPLSGGYDSGGAYWGVGEPLYECYNESGDFTRYVRGRSRWIAKLAILSEFPDAKFHR